MGEDTVLIDGNMLAREMLGDQTQYKMETENGTVFVKEFNDDLLDYGDHQIAVKLSDIACFDMQGKLVGFGLKLHHRRQVSRDGIGGPHFDMYNAVKRPAQFINGAKACKAVLVCQP